MSVEVVGVPNVGPPAAGHPLVWAKDTGRGMGIVKIHWSNASIPDKSACGMLDVATSTYTKPGYTPLHVGYATDAVGLKQAALRVVYANKTTASTALCQPCQRTSGAFAAMVAQATQ